MSHLPTAPKHHKEPSRVRRSCAASGLLTTSHRPPRTRQSTRRVVGSRTKRTSPHPSISDTCAGAREPARCAGWSSDRRDPAPNPRVTWQHRVDRVPVSAPMAFPVWPTSASTPCTAAERSSATTQPAHSICWPWVTIYRSLHRSAHPSHRGDGHDIKRQQHSATRTSEVNLS